MKDNKYIIRKFIYAPSVKEALKKEPKTDVAEIFIDESDKPEDEGILPDCIGFKYITPNEYEL